MCKYTFFLLAKTWKLKISLSLWHENHSPFHFLRHTGGCILLQQQSSLRQHSRCQNKTHRGQRQYHSRAERACGIPVDNIVQDWQYWEDDAWGSHEFDASRYPDPQGMVDSIHALGARLMISVWPKFYTGTEHFRELDERGIADSPEKGLLPQRRAKL